METAIKFKLTKKVGYDNYKVTVKINKVKYKYSGILEHCLDKINKCLYKINKDGF